MKKVGRPRIVLEEEDKKIKYEEYKKHTNERMKKERQDIKQAMEDVKTKIEDLLPNSKVKCTVYGMNIKLSPKDIHVLLFNQ